MLFSKSAWNGDGGVENAYGKVTVLLVSIDIFSFMLAPVYLGA
jgi:hypothetical protein